MLAPSDIGPTKSSIAWRNPNISYVKDLINHGIIDATLPKALWCAHKVSFELSANVYPTRKGIPFSPTLQIGGSTLVHEVIYQKI
jgi:hypothetical protein